MTVLLERGGGRGEGEFFIMKITLEYRALFSIVGTAARESAVISAYCAAESIYARHLANIWRFSECFSFNGIEELCFEDCEFLFSAY